MLWDPFDPISYLGHVVAGVIAVVAGVGALISTKGSQRHVRFGGAFVWAMAVAILTTIIFTFIVQTWIALFAALFAAYLIVTALQAVRGPDGWDTWARTATSLGVSTVGLLVFMAWLIAPEFPERIPILIVFMVIVVTLLARDHRYYARTNPRSAQIRRHLMRMSLAFGVALQAAAVTNQERLGLPGPVALLAPILAMIVVGWVFGTRHQLARPETSDAA